MSQDMDAFCACCAQPTNATTFPAVCENCRKEAGWTMQGCEHCQHMRSGCCFVCGKLHLPIPERYKTRSALPEPTPWLDKLTVGDAAWLHEMKIDPLG